jgi:hypothetical protein
MGKKHFKGSIVVTCLQRTATSSVSAFLKKGPKVQALLVQHIKPYKSTKSLREWLYDYHKPIVS